MQLSANTYAYVLLFESAPYCLLTNLSRMHDDKQLHHIEQNRSVYQRKMVP